MFIFQAIANPVQEEINIHLFGSAQTAANI